MAYSPTTWTEGVTKLGPTNLNHLESGVQATAVVADAAIPKPGGPSANSGLVYNGSSWVAAAIVDANISASAAIAYSKLALAGSIVNNDIASAAGIAVSKLSGPYTAYTPAWTSAGTQPALGNGTIVGSYLQIGKLVQGWLTLTMGSTTTFGTGVYFLSLPVAPASGAIVGGVVVIADASPANTYYHLPAVSGSTVVAGSAASPSVTMTNTAPITFAVSDSISVSFTYQAA